MAMQNICFKYQYTANMLIIGMLTSNWLLVRIGPYTVKVLQIFVRNKMKYIHYYVHKMKGTHVNCMHKIKFRVCV